MADTSLLAWTLLSVGLVLTPGPDMMIVAGHAARGGARAGLAAMAGIMWFVQIAYYPNLACIGPAEFIRYQQEHIRRVTAVA